MDLFPYGDTTPYFRYDVLRRNSRSYLRKHWRRWAIQARDAPLRTEEEPNGRLQHWIWAPELDCFLRVVFEEDRRTLHNMMKDEIFGA